MPCITRTRNFRNQRELCWCAPELGVSCYAVWLYGGLLAFLVSGAVFTSRFAGNTYDDDVKTYAGLVTQWTAPGAAGNQRTLFQGRYSYPNGSATISTVFSVTSPSGNGAAGDTGLMQPVSGLGDSPAMEISPDIPTYSDAQRLRISGSVLVTGGSGSTVPWPASLKRLDAQVTFSDGSASFPTAAAVTVKLPLAFSYTFDPYCTTIGKTTYCRCPIGDSTGTLCIAYYQLKGICILADPANVQALQMGRPPKALGPGCAPLPLISYLNTNIQVPQVDDCYALSTNGVSIGQYEFIGGSQPGSITIGAVPITVRSKADPWAYGMTITQGTGELPQSTSYQRGVSIAMWACFGVWLLAAVFWSSIGCSFCNPCARLLVKTWDTNYDSAAEVMCFPILCCARWHAWMLDPLQNCCGGSNDERARASLRRRSRYGLGCTCCDGCRDMRNGIEVSASCCKDFVGVCFFPSYILWMIFSGLALTINVSQFCGIKTLCDNVQVGIGCARIGDMLAAGPTAKTFYALMASGFAVSHGGLGFMVLGFICLLVGFGVCSRSTQDSFFRGMKTFFLVATPVCFYTGFIIYAAAGAYYANYKTQIGNDYIASLVAVGITPTSVEPTVYPSVLFPLGILFFFLTMLLVSCAGVAILKESCCNFRIPCLCAPCIPERRARTPADVARILAGLTNEAGRDDQPPVRRGSIREATLRAVADDEDNQWEPDRPGSVAATHSNPIQAPHSVTSSSSSSVRAGAETGATTSSEVVITSTTSSAAEELIARAIDSRRGSLVLDEQNQPLPDAAPARRGSTTSSSTEVSGVHRAATMGL